MLQMKMTKMRGEAWRLSALMLALVMCVGCDDDGEDATPTDAAIQADSAIDTEQDSAVDPEQDSAVDPEQDSAVEPDAASDLCAAIDCGLRGACDPEDGVCRCDPGYTGDACEACADGYVSEGDACVADLPIAGDWRDIYGMHYAIDATTWRQSVPEAPEGDATFAITSVDLTNSSLVAQNGADNPAHGGLWSRFDWTWSEGSLYACQTVIDAETEAAAAAAARADDGAPNEAGCGAAPWIRLNAPLSIAGDYTDNYGVNHLVTQTGWSQTMEGLPEYDTHFNITWIDNEAQQIVAQNDEDNPWNAGEWSRYDWTYDETGGLWFCQIVFTATSEAEARAVANPDATDPATTGCSGNPWSRLDLN